MHPELFSLAEYKVRSGVSFEKGYLAGKYGATPILGNMSNLFVKEEPSMAAKRNSPRKERDIRRKVGVRPVKKSFLIVCEGQNTEPDYFNSFRLTSATVKAVGKGLGTRVLVKEVVGIRQEEQRKGKTYDQYWRTIFKKKY